MINLFASPAGRAINAKNSTSATSKSSTTIDCQPIPTIFTTLVANDKNAINKQTIQWRSFENILRPQNISTSAGCIHSINYGRNSCQNYAGDEKWTKKSLKFKSNAIAKKAKFWKFFEEEKWKKGNGDDLQRSNCGKSG